MQWSVVVLAIANLGRVPLLSRGDSDVAIVLNDLVVAGLAGLFLVTALLRRSLLLDAVAGFALLFAAIGFGAAVASVPRYGLSGFELFISLSYLARWLTYFCVYLFIINNVGLDQVRGIWRSLSTVMIAFTGFGVFQSFFLPGFAQMVYPGSREYVDWDPQGQRLVSTVLDPNIAAAMILILLLVQLAQISVGVRVRWWQPGLLLLGLVLTVSRSGLLALTAGLLVILMARGISVRLLRWLGMLAFLSLAIVPRLISFAQTYARFDVGQGSSASTRLMAWLVALATIGDHPVFGIGFNAYGYVKQRMGIDLIGHSAYGSDGGLLFVAVMTGLVGLAVYLAMLQAVILRCRRIWRNAAIEPEFRGLAIGVAAGIVAICVQSVFANSMFTTFVMELLWITWGLTFVIARSAAPATRRATLTTLFHE